MIFQDTSFSRSKSPHTSPTIPMAPQSLDSTTLFDAEDEPNPPLCPATSSIPPLSPKSIQMTTQPISQPNHHLNIQNVPKKHQITSPNSTNTKCTPKAQISQISQPLTLQCLDDNPVQTHQAPRLIPINITMNISNIDGLIQNNNTSRPFSLSQITRAETQATAHTIETATMLSRSAINNRTTGYTPENKVEPYRSFTPQNNPATHHGISISTTYNYPFNSLTNISQTTSPQPVPYSPTHPTQNSSNDRHVPSQSAVKGRNVNAMPSLRPQPCGRMPSPFFAQPSLKPSLNTQKRNNSSNSSQSYCDADEDVIIINPEQSDDDTPPLSTPKQTENLTPEQNHIETSPELLVPHTLTSTYATILTHMHKRTESIVSHNQQLHQHFTTMPITPKPLRRTITHTPFARNTTLSAASIPLSNIPVFGSPSQSENSCGNTLNTPTVGDLTTRQSIANSCEAITEASKFAMKLHVTNPFSYTKEYVYEVNCVFPQEQSSTTSFTFSKMTTKAVDDDAK